MIRNSFVFLDRIGRRTEEMLWASGMTDWSSFLAAEAIRGISGKAKLYYDRKLKEASCRLYSLDSAYFLGRLPSTEMWRLYSFFREEAAFLDIEASGTGPHDSITLVGLFDGTDTKVMIRGINLDFSILQRELARHKLIVTFNGASFDIPFLMKRHPGVVPDIPHIDIRHVCSRAGLSGGLKEIERKLGIKRSPVVEKFYGGDPFLLWRMYLASGDEYYLNLLVEYNEEDVINLKTISDFAVRMLESQIRNSWLLPANASSPQPHPSLGRAQS